MTISLKPVLNAVTTLAVELLGPPVLSSWTAFAPLFDHLQGKCAHADALYARATEILEKDPDQNRLQLILTLNNRLEILESQARAS